MLKLEGSQILIQEKTGTYEIWTHYGMEKQVAVETQEDKIIHKWMKFNLVTRQYEDDPNNNSPITVGGIAYTPVNGKVEFQIGTSAENAEKTRVQQLEQENLELKLALAELAEKSETDKQDLQLALAELAETLIGGVE
ncbi:hypothetical protein [Geosporobacter ferrireducens]|uniref:hypothetical protein n=1 Tax=Geosporobacter ferrireducens TaxID=1424294 RepID=UPI00139D5701|nr:hypothetical protein [Geosporobacter ferrireducens]MTI56168.1 hypothetical protein [Geosporobacter ferrireducens]